MRTIRRIIGGTGLTSVFGFSRVWDDIESQAMRLPTADIECCVGALLFLLIIAVLAFVVR